MQVDCDPRDAALASEALLESCAWSQATFFDGEGPTEPDLLADGIPGRTLHFVADDGKPKCHVWLPILIPAAAIGLPDVAAHEGFHVAAGANVYHWTHEVLACLAAHLSHLRTEENRSAQLARRQLGNHLLGQARLFSMFYTAQDMRLATVPNSAPVSMQQFYARARVVGVELYEITKLDLLAQLARAVRDARCDMRPHHFHDDCPMDQAVEDWVTDLVPETRGRVRDVLRLA